MVFHAIFRQISNDCFCAISFHELFVSAIITFSGYLLDKRDRWDSVKLLGRTKYPKLKMSTRFNHDVLYFSLRPLVRQRIETPHIFSEYIY